jgi:tRNA modification GTPase
MDSDIIVALATPPGESALAVLRLSGGGSSALAEECFGLPEGRLSGMRRALAEIHGGFEGVRVMLISWPAGRSFTGEEMVEVMIPGSMKVAGEALSALYDRGARQAEPGEFTRRALVSGHLTPLQVIGLASIWSGPGPRAGETILESSARRLEHALDVLIEDLESSIEFSEEHMLGEAGIDTSPAREAAASFASDASEVEASRRIFFMGPVNAGKSTLFNAILGTERAVVSEQAGTTRDGASERTHVHGKAVELFDTPGCALESGGSRTGPDGRALEIAQGMLRKDDIVVWMSPGGKMEPPVRILEDAGLILRVSSRSDEMRGPGINVSAVSGEGVDDVRRMISEALPAGLVSSRASGMVRIIERACEILESGDEAAASAELGEALAQVRSMLDEGRGIELAVERALGRLCIGK